MFHLKVKKNRTFANVSIKNKLWNVKKRFVKKLRIKKIETFKTLRLVS